MLSYALFESIPSSPSRSRALRYHSLGTQSRNRFVEIDTQSMIQCKCPVASSLLRLVKLRQQAILVQSLKFSHLVICHAKQKAHVYHFANIARTVPLQEHNRIFLDPRFDICFLTGSLDRSNVTRSATCTLLVGRHLPLLVHPAVPASHGEQLAIIKLPSSALAHLVLPLNEITYMRPCPYM